MLAGGAQHDNCFGGGGRDSCNGGAPRSAKQTADRDFCARDVERTTNCRRSR
jgi:hypothetical protein